MLLTLLKKVENDDIFCVLLLRVFFLVGGVSHAAEDPTEQQGWAVGSRNVLIP